VLATGIAGLVMVAVVVFGLTRATDTPHGAARQYIHARLTGDENTIMNTLAADLRASTTSFCTQPYAACLLGHIPLVVGSTDLDSQLIRQTGQLALVQVRVHPSNAPADLCVQVQMRNENGWKVLGTTSNPAPCEANQVALVSTQLPVATVTDSAPLSAVTVATPTLPPMPTVNPALPPIVQTATALQQENSLTATGLAQVANLTQAVIQQGALGATVMAQQTSQAVLSNLSGHLVMASNSGQLPVASPKIQLVPTYYDLNHVSPHRTLVASRTALTPDSQSYTITHPDGSQARQITGLPASADARNRNGTDNWLTLWSPDEKWLFMVVNNQGYLVDVTRAAAQPVFLDLSLTSTERLNAAWSADSQQLAVTGTTNGTPAVASPFMLAVLKVSQPDTAGLRLPLPKASATPQPYVRNVDTTWVLGWLPDQTHIIIENDTSAVSKPSVTFSAVDASTGTQQVIRQTVPSEMVVLSSLPHNGFSLSPDSQWIVLVAANPSGQYYLYVLSIDGRVLKPLVRVNDSVQYAAMVGGLTGASVPVVTWSPDSRHLLVTMSTEQKGIVTQQVVSLPDLTVQPVLPDALPIMEGVSSVGFLWSPDSQSLMACQFVPPNGPDSRSFAEKEKVLWLPLAHLDQPVTLFSDVGCPFDWLP